jgi:predicted metalloprotease
LHPPTCWVCAEADWSFLIRARRSVSLSFTSRFDLNDRPVEGNRAIPRSSRYCPNDRKVYLDTSFFQDLERRFRGCEVGSKGCQFSQAYVITHEIGHHVQNLLGILPKVQQMQHGLDQAEANQLQVRVELQADCLSGVWAHHAEEQWRLIEPGDVEAAMQTASAIGDDRLQRRSQGYVVPDAFTHGSSAQRTRWFLAGLKSGELASCDTFGAQQL